MAKIDYKKELRHLYRPSGKKVEIVQVPEMNFLMIDGKGDPNASVEFQNAVEALFSVSYTLKFMIKKSETGIDYAVLPLEGLWWTDDMSQFSVENKDIWKWTLLIMQPEFVTAEIVGKALKLVKEKKALAALQHIRFEKYSEGTAAQIMHMGPFSEEGPTIEKLHNFIEERGNQLFGKHHEIYLSDIRRAAPKNWKTIVRQPFR